LLRESDISTEYPADVDDENLAEQGFSPALPGELTKISSALALFKICRILSRALDQLLPASVSHQISVNNLKAINDELGQWLQSIPPHLRMKFLNDKPSTGVISDRSPLLVRPSISSVSFPLTRLPVSGLLFHPESNSSSSCLSWFRKQCFSISDRGR
jgi:hypothetical protein